MNIYEYVDYREIIKKVIKQERKLNPDRNFQQMAEYMRTPKSYLSKVINGTADFNSDQLFLAMDYLVFNEKEREYMSLLLEYQRSSLQKRREVLLSQIKQIQNQNLQTSEHIKTQILQHETQDSYEYYLNPLLQIIHVALTINRYQKDVDSLCRDLGYPKEMVYEGLAKLQKIGIIESRNDQYKSIINNLHLPPESPLYRSWRNQIKSLAQNRLATLSEKHSYSYSAVFSATEQDRVQIRSLFLEFLSKAQGSVKDAQPEQIYHLNFDLFPWTTPL